MSNFDLMGLARTYTELRKENAELVEAHNRRTDMLNNHVALEREESDDERASA